jgi:hypothetical protein
MSRGVLYLAFNNQKVNYIAQATWNALRVRRHLGVGVSLVTDEASKPNDTSMFDSVMLVDSKSGGTRKYDHMNADSSAEWKNIGRCNAYELSPYDQTLMLDTDYIVNCNQLAMLFDLDYDFLCHREVLDVTDRQNFARDTRFGNTAFPMWWATVTYFRKSNLAKDIFDVWKMVEDNWYHYSCLYQFDRDLFRNDYAVSIALATVYGHRLDIPSIPWPLATAFYDVYLNEIGEDKFKMNYVRIDKKELHQNMILADYDLHVMNKPDLGKLIGSIA